MLRTLPTILFLFLLFVVRAQDVTLPVDLRQHNLTEYNSSFFHPAFSLTANNPSSIAVWSRWQWQSPDADPTTLFLNYTHKLNESSVAGAGFYQHNTGIFLNTGGVLNYSYVMEINERATLALGLNLFGFKQKLSDDRFQPDPQIQLPQLVITDDFVLQMAPGLLFSLDRFSVGIASENLFDYNFTTNERHSKPEDRIYTALASYAFPLGLFNFKETVLRPMVYYKSIPDNDAQIGLTTLLSTEKFWAQAGYNNFYGISFGGGGRFFKRVSIGALMELGMGNDLSGKDPTFEVLAAYRFMKSDKEIEENAVADEDVEDEKLEKKLAKEEEKAQRLAEKEQEKLAKEKAKRTKDSLDLAKKQQDIDRKKELEERQKRIKDSLDLIERNNKEVIALQREQQRKQDSINKVREAEALAEKQRQEQLRKQDSIAKAEALAEAERLRAKREIDSLTQVRIAEAEVAKKAEEEKAVEQEEVVEVDPADRPQDGEKYEEVNTEDGLEPGYYLITNVFGTKKYFDAFMKDLTRRGLEPKSFLRSLNNYNYVYLKRYDTMTEARKARDSKFDGRYQDKTWIFRVVGK
ncbi:PorP/SprF family type IX secretion system membrane protein [Maribacter algicola]|uniref:PorP/SprF family type IX secretion system membrane protein n=1 Tax=Meishania litoralis TaxID=3434685 RepID=A0ACC7LK47_9FLAO